MTNILLLTAFIHRYFFISALFLVILTIMRVLHCHCLTKIGEVMDASIHDTVLLSHIYLLIHDGGQVASAISGQIPAHFQSNLTLESKF